MADILPAPMSVTPGEGSFLLDASAAISAPTEFDGVAAWLQSELRAATGLPLPIRDGAASIALTFDANLPAEGYLLSVSGDGVSVTASTPAGAFYAAQVLRQLLPAELYRRAPIGAARSWSIDAVTVADAPRFPWRGMMLDVARHFMPKHGVMRIIDLMAMHRLNTLHWHLSEDQGWRVEILRYPLLTEVGGWRSRSQVGPPPHSGYDNRPHGGYYTQDDIREVVAYAAARHITVVPEIDLPGHSQAAIAAYPQLGVGVDAEGNGGPDLEVAPFWGVIEDVLNTEDSTVEFFRNVLDEIMDLFPSTIIGIGGDECPKNAWRGDARTQELMAQRGITSEVGLQSWFLDQLAAHLATRSRRAFGWDEILEGQPAEGTIVLSWRGMTGAAAATRRGFDVVACPNDRAYLDYRQSELANEPIPFAVPVTLADCYGFEPVPDGATADEAAHVLGGQANIWTEHMDSPRTVDYFMFPRLCAIAEVLWSQSHDDFADFERRLDGHLARLDAIGVEYRRADGPRPWQERPGITGRTQTRAEYDAETAELVASITH